MRAFLVLGLALALAGVVAIEGAGRVAAQAPTTAQDGFRGRDFAVFATFLTGAAEVPGPGDPDGVGGATVALHGSRGQICFALAVARIAPATAAHIHRAAAGVAGPVVVPLTPPTNGFSFGCVSVDPTLIREIIGNPAGFYVNVHTADFPQGAIRGQLR